MKRLKILATITMLGIVQQIFAQCPSSPSLHYNAIQNGGFDQNTINPVLTTSSDWYSATNPYLENGSVCYWYSPLNAADYLANGNLWNGNFASPNPAVLMNVGANGGHGQSGEFVKHTFAVPLETNNQYQLSFDIRNDKSQTHGLAWADSPLDWYVAKLEDTSNPLPLDPTNNTAGGITPIQPSSDPFGPWTQVDHCFTAIGNHNGLKIGPRSNPPGSEGMKISMGLDNVRLFRAYAAATSTVNAGSVLGSSGPFPSGWSYEWMPTLGLSNSNSPNPIANPTETTIYTLTITTTEGCNLTDQVTVIAPENPCNFEPMFDISSHGNMCSMVFTDMSWSSLPPGITVLQVNWNFGDGTTTTGNLVVHNFSTPGTYTVCMEVWTTNGITCCLQEYCQELTISEVCDPCTELNNAVVSVSQINGVYTFSEIYLTDSYDYNYVYYWNFGDGDFAIGKTVTHTYNDPDFNPSLASLSIYYYDQELGQCCKKQITDMPGQQILGTNSESQEKLKRKENPLEQISTNNKKLLITPNPSSGRFSFQTENTTIKDISVFDQTGKRVYWEKLSGENNSYSIDLSNLNLGLYFVLINKQDFGNHISEKLVIQ